jgi:iron(III) transport system substrate-binding protein
MQEHQAGLKVTDVFEIALVAAAVEMKTKGMLEPYLPRDAAKFDAKYRAGDRLYNEYYVNVQFIAYNPKLISAADAPKRWKDIYEPKWKGKLTVSHPKFSGITVDWLMWQAKLSGGWDFLQTLKANDPIVVRSSAESIPLLTNGERPLNAQAYSDAGVGGQVRASRLEINYPRGGRGGQPRLHGILKSAPHPNAARCSSTICSRSSTRSGWWITTCT